jgi:hypothetical protein
VAARAILLLALGAFLLSTITRADNGPTLPSRKAAVVIPLLSHLAAKSDLEKDVLVELNRILGNYDNASTSHRHSQVRQSSSYHFDDGDKVVAIFLDSQLVMIYAPTQKDPDWVIYPHPAPE